MRRKLDRFTLFLFDNLAIFTLFEICVDDLGGGHALMTSGVMKACEGILPRLGCLGLVGGGCDVTKRLYFKVNHLTVSLKLGDALFC